MSPSRSPFSGSRVVALRTLAGRGHAHVAARPLHAVVYAAVAGLLCGPRAPGVAVLFAVVLLGAGACGPAATLLRRRRASVDGEPASGTAPEIRPAPALPVVLALALLLGAVVGDARVASLEHSRLAPELGRTVSDRLDVQEAPRRSRFGGWSVIARLRGEPVLLRVGGEVDRPPPVGSIVRAEGRLRPPGDFAAVRGAHAELRAANVVVEGRRGGVAGALDATRARAETALDRGLGPAAAGLLRGMVLGQDDALPEDTRDEFRAAGLSHLVAASGTNVVLLAALAMVLGTALGLGLSGRLWLVLALIAIYVPLAGGGASIQRAGIMGAAAVAAGLVGRPGSRWYALGLAALVTLTLDPRAAEDPGWQLSFVAVVSLLVLAPGWRAALVRRGLPAALAEVTAMTAAATVATAPVVAAHFGQASLVGIPANVLAAPAVAPVMWLGVVAAALGQLLALGGPAGAVIGVVVDGLDAACGFPLGYLLWVGSTAAALPGAVVQTGPLVVCATAAVLVLMTASPRARRAAAPAALLAAAGWVALATPASAPASAPAGFRVTFLDVGQGDATLVQDGERAVLVDAGLPDAGILELLERAGVERLDLFVATHASADHEGGAAAVVGGLPVAAVLSGLDGASTPGGDAMAAAAAARGIRVLPARAGQLLVLGHLRIRVLWPRPAPVASHVGAEANERAVVLEVEARGVRTLLTADAESVVLAQLALRPVDVLKVSHHGSADPGLPAVLRRLRPRVAGIEVGEGNSYGHPAPSTLDALTAVPVVVRTDRDGSVRLDLTESGRWEVRAHA